MKRPRWQKVLHDLWGNRIRSLLVVASISVGLFALGVMMNIYFVALDDMQRGYAAQNPANLAIQSSYFSQGLVDAISDVDGVYQAQGMRIFGTRLETAPEQWVAIDIQAYNDPANYQINQVKLIDGVWPPGEREIVIDQFKLDETEAQIGDMVFLETSSGKTRPVKIVGVVQDQTIGAFRGSGGFFNASAQGYIDKKTVEWLEQSYPDMYNTLYVTVAAGTDSQVNMQAALEQVRKKLEDNHVEIISTALRRSTEHPNLYLVQAVLAVLVVIGLLVVFLSGFLITNTLQALLNQQVQQIGILKSVGARRIQIVTIYLTLNLLYGLLALAVALPLSSEVAFRIVNFLTVQTNTAFYGFRLVPQVILTEILLAVLMPQIAAFFPVLQGTNISIQEALSGIRQDKPPDQGWIDRSLSRLRNFSMMLVISLRNTFRRKGRLALTMITLTLGGAVFISTFNVRVSLANYVDQIIRYFLADVNVTLDRSYRIDEIRAIIESVPGVEYVEGWAYARTELLFADGSVGESVAILAPPADSPLVDPIIVEGRWIQPGDQNAITLSELFRERFPDMKVGDTIRLNVNNEESDWVIVGFYQLAGKVSGFAAYANYDYLTDLTHQNGRSAGYRVVSSKKNLTNVEQQVLGRAIEAKLAEYGIRAVDITEGESLGKTASDGFNVLTAFLLLLAILTALVGSIGLTGTMSLNVMERTREIGVLRAIGASDKMLMRLVLIEGAFIGMLSWVLASITAFPISRLIADAISLSLFGGQSNFGFTFVGFGLWLVAVIILSVLASVIPARNTTRLTIREVLSYE